VSLKRNEAPQMTLATQAHELVQLLRAVVVALDRFDCYEQREYTRSLADRLRPFAAQFETAVVSERHRASAERVLADLAQVMDEVNGAATKGEMEIFDDDTLSRYWDLSTIFQDSRFSGQSL
jgi:hypothetical protein